MAPAVADAARKLRRAGDEGIVDMASALVRRGLAIA
jgi:hypothetical protein